MSSDYIGMIGVLLIPLIFFVALYVGISHTASRCAAAHGHLYTASRPVLCVTSDNRIIENW